MITVQNDSGFTRNESNMCEEIYRAYYDKKMSDISRTLLKDIFSNNNSDCPDTWVANYCTASFDSHGQIQINQQSYIIDSVHNLSYTRLMNDILPTIQMRRYFLGWITKQYPIEYYRKLFKLDREERYQVNPLS